MAIFNSYVSLPECILRQKCLKPFILLYKNFRRVDCRVLKYTHIVDCISGLVGQIAISLSSRYPHFQSITFCYSSPKLMGFTHPGEVDHRL